MKPKKVLIIDDERMIRITTSILLKKHSIETFCASNGKEGLELAKQEKPDLILLDILMPDMDGWEVLALLQIDDSLKHIPVVIFTADDHLDFDTITKEKSVYTFLKKPFALPDLLSICDIQTDLE